MACDPLFRARFTRALCEYVGHQCGVYRCEEAGGGGVAPELMHIIHCVKGGGSYFVHSLLPAKELLCS